MIRPGRPSRRDRHLGVAVVRDQNRRRMAAAGEADPPRRRIVDAVPHREVLAVVLIHRERRVQVFQHRRGIAEIGVVKRLGPQDMGDRHRQQRGADAVPADVDDVDRQVLRHRSSDSRPRRRRAGSTAGSASRWKWRRRSASAAATGRSRPPPPVRRPAAPGSPSAREASAAPDRAAPSSPGRRRSVPTAAPG